MVGSPLPPVELVVALVPAPEVVRPEAEVAGPAEVEVVVLGAPAEVVVLAPAVEVVVRAGPAVLVVVEDVATAGRVGGFGLLWTAKPTTPATSRAAMPPPATSTGVPAPEALPASRTTHYV